jgi:hypothetical protein
MVNEENYRSLEPPKPGEGFGNTETKEVRVNAITGKPRTQSKGLVQLNVKVRGKTKARFEAVYAATRADAPDLTKGDFFDLMLAAFEAKSAGVNLGQMIEAMHQTPAPPAKDKAAGRERAIEVFVTSDLAKALKLRGSKNGWTVSETVEHACAMAKKVEGLSAELDKPCGHCGKSRKGQKSW